MMDPLIVIAFIVRSDEAGGFGMRVHCQPSNRVHSLCSSCGYTKYTRLQPSAAPPSFNLVLACIPCR